MKKNPNPLRGIPNNWCQLLKTQLRPCPKCHAQGKNKITTSWHMKYAHKIDIKPTRKIWREEIKPLTSESEGKERKSIIKTLEPLIDEHIKRYNSQLKWPMATI